MVCAPAPQRQNFTRKRCRGHPAARPQPFRCSASESLLRSRPKPLRRARPTRLGALGVPNFTVASAKAATAEGPFPARCVVEGTIATDGDGAGPNSARLRVQLPETWNGKLVFFGVGGLAGSLDPSANPHDFVSALGLGYATAITDTGHVGKNPFDANWILEAPGKPNKAKIIDYFYRAPHQATVAAKTLASDSTARPKVSASLFRRMLVRRPHGAHGGDAIPRRL